MLPELRAAVQTCARLLLIEQIADSAELRYDAGQAVSIMLQIEPQSHEC